MTLLYKRNGRTLYTHTQRKLRCFKQKVLVSTDINSDEAEEYFADLKSAIHKKEGRDLNTIRQDRKYIVYKDRFFYNRIKKFNI